MANWSGNGSTLVIGAAVLHCTNVRIEKGARLGETTSSASASTSYIPVVFDHSWSASVPWDDTNLPDTDFGLEPGAVVALVSGYGESGKNQTLTGTTVEKVTDVLDNRGDIIRTEISGRGGVHTPATT